MSKFYFDINHPGQVHMFRNLISELKEQGHDVNILCRKSTLILWLMEKYRLSYIVNGPKTNVILLKYLNQLRHLFRAYKHYQRNRPEIGLGVSMILPILSRFTKMKAIAFDDDDKRVTPMYALSARLAHTLLTPSSLSGDKRGKNHIYYDGYHELAYLHPNRFSPNPEVLTKLGIRGGEKYFLLRFNSFGAHHDVGEKGMSFHQKLHLVSHMEKYGKVFISAEQDIDPEFRNYILPTGPDEIHSVLFYAAMYIGESQTMTSEAAVLGTPAFKCNTFAGRLSIPNELENVYTLCFAFHSRQYDEMLQKIDSLIALPDLKQEWQQRRIKMLNEKIDVTAFYLWFVTNYPESRSIMKQNPSFQYQFRKEILPHQTGWNTFF